ncbi:hypothetical protein KCP74_22645 [Salmonella enterica subsp. enterica]|nr:hypothetical protein KCP74_22645 [Salmonella enterica subsp. enterica]
MPSIIRIAVINPLTGQWVLVSPHRAKRPRQGAGNAVSANAAGPRSDCSPVCGQYVSPAIKNPDYKGTWLPY